MFYVDNGKNFQEIKSDNIPNITLQNANSDLNYLNVEIKTSPNTTPRNASPVLTPSEKLPLYNNEQFLSSNTPVVFSSNVGLIASDNNVIQTIPLSALRGNSITNNTNALVTQDFSSKQQESDASKEDILDDIVNMYRLRGNNHNDNHYMSETSSNASSCSSVCGWSYGGSSSNINGNTDHNSFYENKHSQGKEKGVGSGGNSRSSNSHPSHFKRHSSNSFGLDPIPEYDVAEGPPIFQPLVPPAVVVPKPFSENISFPTTLQPRANDRLNICRTSVNSNTVTTGSTGHQQPKQFASISHANEISTQIPPLVFNHPETNAHSNNYGQGLTYQQIESNDKAHSPYQISENNITSSPTEPTKKDPKRGESKHLIPLSPSNSSYVSPRDLEVAMHIESNSSYHPSPSSRVSSPSFEKIDINNSTTSQRSSRSYTKPSKRSRSNTPTNMYNNEMRDQEAREAGVSSRQRRKSNVNSGSAGNDDFKYKYLLMKHYINYGIYMNLNLYYL